MLKKFRMLKLCSVLEKFIKEFRGNLVEVCGPPGSGKTAILLSCVYSFLKRKEKIFYMDSDRTFSPVRLISMGCSKLELENMIISRPRSFEEQKKILFSLNHVLTEKFSFLAIDSFTSLYREEIARGRSIIDLQTSLNAQLALLYRLTKKFNVTTIITNQVFYDPEKGEDRIVGGKILENWPDYIIKLERRGEKRKAKLYKGKSESKLSAIDLLITPNKIIIL